MTAMLDVRPRARSTDPEASHDAAARLSTADTHCRALLEAFAVVAPEALTDVEAAELIGMDRVEAGRRGADLRAKGLIRWVLDGESGKPVRRYMESTGRRCGISKVTEQGLAFLAS
ncbi:hypothetical protein SEA_TOPANGA_64 [Mycobacterium phage Topanga]|nr:hypothetical protein SEA_TOPANGA_64 [Mycobacterium phage Topanga]